MSKAIRKLTATYYNTGRLPNDKHLRGHVLRLAAKEDKKAKILDRGRQKITAFINRALAQ